MSSRQISSLKLVQYNTTSTVEYYTSSTTSLYVHIYDLMPVFYPLSTYWTRVRTSTQITVDEKVEDHVQYTCTYEYVQYVTQ